MLATIKPYSPTKDRDFVWVAEYSDGSHIAEYDFQTGNENSFYSIRRQDAIHFGLFGHGYKFYYELFGGHIKTPIGLFDFAYKMGDKEYSLTGQGMFYRDLITFKRAEACFNPQGGRGNSSSTITEYVFGYKHQMQIDDVNFSFKVLVHIPFNQPAYISLGIVADQEMDGVLHIKRDGVVVEEVKAPLEKDIGGEIKWILQ